MSAYTKKELEKLARKLAENQHHNPGECEIDDTAKVSLSFDEESDEPETIVKGAYVQAWVWIDFPKETTQTPEEPEILLPSVEEDNDLS